MVDCHPKVMSTVQYVSLPTSNGFPDNPGPVSI